MQATGSVKYQATPLPLCMPCHKSPDFCTNLSWISDMIFMYSFSAEEVVIICKLKNQHNGLEFHDPSWILYRHCLSSLWFISTSDVLVDKDTISKQPCSLLKNKNFEGAKNVFVFNLKYQWYFIPLLLLIIVLLQTMEVFRKWWKIKDSNNFEKSDQLIYI